MFIFKPSPRHQVESEVVQRYEGVSLSAVVDGSTRALVGETRGRKYVVSVQTLDALRLAEGIIADVKNRCIPHAGNQIADVFATSGWSFAKARACRKEQMKLASASLDKQAASIVRHRGGNCAQYGVCTFVLTAERIRRTAEEVSVNPLLTRPLFRLVDSDLGHSWVMWGDKRDRKWGGEAIVIDSWPGLAKPFLLKERNELSEHLHATATVTDQFVLGSSATHFSLDVALAEPVVSDEELAEYLRSLGAPREAGTDLLRWIANEHKMNAPLHDEIRMVQDVSACYIDRHGRYGVFDHQSPDYLTRYTAAHRSARDAGFPDAGPENPVPGTGEPDGDPRRG